MLLLRVHAERVRECAIIIAAMMADAMCCLELANAYQKRVPSDRWRVIFYRSNDETFYDRHETTKHRSILSDIKTQCRFGDAELFERIDHHRNDTPIMLNKQWNSFRVVLYHGTVDES